MPVDQLHVLPGLQPSHDPTFVDRLEAAMRGRLEVYFAAIPPSLIEPFDAVYAPRDHPIGEAAVRQTIEEWQAGHFHTVLVYQEGDHFVLSDDYIFWEAAKEGRPDFLPCWVLGKPEHTGIVDVQGPLAQLDVPRAVGLG